MRQDHFQEGVWLFRGRVSFFGEGGLILLLKKVQIFWKEVEGFESTWKRLRRRAPTPLPPGLAVSAKVKEHMVRV